ncbi:MAG: hypothetical protein ABJ381_03570, partial [Ilumatobacter sp.]|uniref:hypothetical protein n=1 Tax=Ilumatobacter sp. TaxID=1967498 RepID=UPI0032969D03
DERAPLTVDDRAAARAFVARCEVRLSTIHRIAVGMLSGAGLLVVLPVVARDSVSGVLRSLLIDGVGFVDIALVVGVVAMLAVPVVALWLLFADLTRFYFHANHLGGDGRDVFTPRFTLTSLKLPSDELGPTARDQLSDSRNDPRIVELLVPANDTSRRRVDRQLQVYPGLDSGPDDVGRADGLFELAAATSRTLLEEVAKVEYGMARHVLRLRELVLRYVKALLALLTTALAVYSGDAIVVGLDQGQGMTVSGSVALAAVVLVWAPAVVLAVTSPVRWIEKLMRDDGAPSTAVADDPDLTHVERVSLRIAAVGWLAAAVAMVVSAIDDATGGQARAMGLAVLAGSLIAVTVAATSGRFRSLARIP